MKVFFCALISATLFAAEKVSAQDTLRQEWTVNPFSRNEQQQEIILGGTRTLSFETYAGFSSNAVNAKFTAAMIRGKFIDDSLKARVRRNLWNQNGFGSETGFELSYSFPSKHKTFVSHLSYADRTLTRAWFSRDVFTLGFYGNSVLANENAKLAPSSFESMAFRQIGYGIQTHEKIADVKITTAIRINLLQGISDATARMKQGSLFTAIDGQYIDLNYQFDLQLNDTIAENVFYQTNFGASSDVAFCFALPTGWKIYLQALDLGMIRWKKESLHYAGDTSIHFEGIHVDDLLNITASSFGSANQDSVISWVGIKRSSEAYYSTLPYRFSLSLFSRSWKKIILSASTTWQPMVDIIPQTCLAALFSMKSNWSFSVRGGISNFLQPQWGVGFVYEMHELKFFGSLLSPDAFLVPSLTRSLNGSAGILWSF